MSEDQLWCCMKCSKIYLEKEMVPDRSGIGGPFCPRCKSREAVESCSVGHLLKKFRGLEKQMLAERALQGITAARLN